MLDHRTPNFSAAAAPAAETKAEEKKKEEEEEVSDDDMGFGKLKNNISISTRCWLFSMIIDSYVLASEHLSM